MKIGDIVKYNNYRLTQIYLIKKAKKLENYNKKNIISIYF